MKRPLILLCCTLLIACGSRVNPANYDKIRAGMSEAEVRAVLGHPTEVSSFGIGSVSGTTVVWQDRGGTISVHFFNGKVQIKNFAQPSR